MGKRRLATVVLSLAVGAFVAGSPARAENGVSADKIVLGQSAALDGPAAALGQGGREGLLAAFLTVIKSDGNIQAVEKRAKVGG